MLIGGLGLFLYGMKLMSDGLEAAAGDKLRTGLGLMTKNRFSALKRGRNGGYPKLIGDYGYGRRLRECRADVAHIRRSTLASAPILVRRSPHRSWPSR